MNGNILKEKLQMIDIQFVELSKKLNISPQSLNSRLKTKDVTISFLIELCQAVKKSPYYFLKGSEYEKFFSVDENILKVDLPTGNNIPIIEKIEQLQLQNDQLKENLENSKKSESQLEELLVFHKEKIQGLEQKLQNCEDEKKLLENSKSNV